MKKLGYFMAGAMALAAASGASAATFVPGSSNFSVSGNLTSGPVTFDIGNSGIAAGTFTDLFNFSIPQTGLASISLATSTSSAGNLTDTDFTRVTLNGTAATLTPSGLVEFASATGVPITSGAQNTLTVTGLSRGNGSYGGQITFQPTTTSAVPEAGTWAMMLFGFGGMGVAMRRRRRSSLLVQAA